MFTSFDIPIAGKKKKKKFANINTNIDKTTYKPISFLYN